MVPFIVWVAGLWWILGLAALACAVPLGPLIAACMDAEEGDGRPMLYGATRILVLGFSWAVTGLVFSGACNIIAVFL